MRFATGLLLTATTALLLQGLPAIAGTKHDLKKACRQSLGKGGYADYNFHDMDVVKVRSGGWSVTGQGSNGSSRIEFSCVFDDNKNIVDAGATELDRRDTDDGEAVSMEVMSEACTEEGDGYWSLPSGTTTMMEQKKTGKHMYEIKIAGGDNTGVCTVTDNGHVKFIMND